MEIKRANKVDFKHIMSIPNHDIPFHRYGIEFEFYGPELDEVRACLFDVGLTARGWQVEYDSSVDPKHGIPLTREQIEIEGDEAVVGLEVKSPPLKGEDGIRQLKGACKALKTLDAKTHYTTGLHMHFDMEGYSFEEIKRIVKAFIVYEDGLDFFTFAPRGRMFNNSTYAQSLVQKFSDADVHEHTEQGIAQRGEIYETLLDMGMAPSFNELAMVFDCFHNLLDEHKSAAIQKGLEAVDACESVDDLIKLFGHDRYMKLNLMSLKTYGTIEYRQPGGEMELSFENVFSILSYFDMFLAAAVDEALPMGDDILEQSAERRSNILFSLYACTPYREVGYHGLPWVPGMKKFARRYWPDYTREHGIEGPPGKQGGEEPALGIV